MRFTLVGDQEPFEALIARAIATGQVALDTEAASFHRYHDRVYLVQLTAAGETSVIDVKNPSGFTVLSRNPLGEKTQASMAASNHHLFIRTAQNLYCIGSK